MIKLLHVTVTVAATVALTVVLQKQPFYCLYYNKEESPSFSYLTAICFADYTFFNALFTCN